MRQIVFIVATLCLTAATAFASGFGVFTQGASGLGQANAVVAHPVGPSSLYFNPALLNDISGRQIEIGTTAVYADRSINLDSGASEDSRNNLNFPSNAYYTHQVNDRLSTGFGLFFPFGLSTEWDDDYEGRYIGTKGDITTLNINPVISWRLRENLSLAAGISLVYLDATLGKNINQTAAYSLTNAQLGGILPALSGPLTDISQSFEGEGWGHGFNLGLLYKITDSVNLGATYRSHVDISVSGRASFDNVDPNLAMFVSDTNGHTDIRLPAQATAGLAFTISPGFVVEAGARWEDWESFENLTVDLDRAVLGQTTDITPRDWRSTWSYNIGGQYQLNRSFALNAGYLYGENAVPDSTFEPSVPDSDAHLFTLGLEWTLESWKIIAAFGYEYHDDRDKNNNLGDPLGSALAAEPTATANGNYESTIYLYGLSIVHMF